MFKQRVFIRCLVSAVIGVFVLSSPGMASDDVIRTLTERLDKLEQENAELRAEINAIKGQVEGVKKETRDSKTMGGEESEGNLIVNKPPVQIEVYGMIKTDMIYNDSQAGESGSQAPSESEGARDNDEFLFNARDSRIGLNFIGPKIFDDGEMKGKIEFDFNGSSDDHSTSSQPRFRHVYAQASFPNWSLLAGQTNAFFSPYNPTTLTVYSMRRKGNVGYRHAQLRLTNMWENIPGGDLKTDVGLIETDDLNADAGSPDFVGYITYTTELLDRPLEIGVGGLYGQADISSTVDKNVDIWAVTGHIKYQPLDEWQLLTEFFKGAGLTSYRGLGPSEVTNASDETAKAIAGSGGWVQIKYNPNDKWEINNTYGIEDIKTTLGAADTTTWDYQYSHLHNVFYKITNNVSVGLEYQRIVAKFKQKDGGDLNRWMTSIIYKF